MTNSAISVDAIATPEAAGFSHELLERLTHRLAADVAAGEIPGAVALIIRDGHLAYFQAFGFADRKTQAPMHRGTGFRIASMTKPVTVAAALKLQQEGRLLLTDPVARYLPEIADLKVGVETIDAVQSEGRMRLVPVERPMTVQDLMRHTAGFTYGHSGDSLIQRQYLEAVVMDPQQNNEEMLLKLAKIPLAFQPGSTFEYGMSTDVLGRVIEIVAQCGLDQYLLDNITGPLGMASTAFANRFSGTLAQPDYSGRPVPYDPARAPRWCSGGGGLLSTAADYARFCQMLLDGGSFDGVRLLSRKSVDLMTRNHLPPGIAFGAYTPELGLAAPLPHLGQGYGLGLGVRLHEGLCAVPGSAGDFYWGGAAGPYFWVDPVEGLIVVFMLQELDVDKRVRYRSLLRSFVYQALA